MALRLSIPCLVGGQPIYPVPMGWIITFEMTMLGLMGFAFIGLFIDSGFPAYTPMEYLPEVSDGKIAVLFPLPEPRSGKIHGCVEKRRRRISCSGGGASLMSTSLSVILRRFAIFFSVVGVLFGIMMLFSFDIIKIDWPSFMEIQPSYRPMENPLPVPSASIPIEGPVAIPGMLPPENPIEADENSIARGAELYDIHCKMCHGAHGGEGTVRSLPSWLISLQI